MKKIKEIGIKLFDIPNLINEENISKKVKKTIQKINLL